MKNKDLFLLNIGFGLISDYGLRGSYLSPIKLEQTWAY